MIKLKFITDNSARPIVTGAMATCREHKIIVIDRTADAAIKTMTQVLASKQVPAAKEKLGQ